MLRWDQVNTVSCLWLVHDQKVCPLSLKQPTLLPGIRICGIQDGIMAWPIKYSNGNCKSILYPSLIKGGVKVSLKEDPRDSFQTLQWQESTFTERIILLSGWKGHHSDLLSLFLVLGSHLVVLQGPWGCLEMNKPGFACTHPVEVSLLPYTLKLLILPLSSVKPSPRKSEPFINRAGEGNLLLSSAFTKSCLTL